MSDLSFLAIVPAAGVGSRMGRDIPKAYLPFAGMPVMAHAIEALQAQKLSIVAAINPAHQTYFAPIGQRFPELMTCLGGATRQESVRLALQFAKKTLSDMPGHVLIHDAARPFLRAKLLQRLMRAAAQHPESAIVPGLPPRDTVRQCCDDGRTVTLLRDRLSLIQTPQIFPLAKLFELHQQCREQNLTDDAMLFEQAGLDIQMIDGDPDNVKITYPEDLPMPAADTDALEYRSAQGFDVHAFAPGDSVTLCGVTLPFAKTLAGHSDADVALHALTDAILGSIAAGDIGMHFPPSDPQWRNGESKIFLQHALSLLHERKARLVFCDLTLICEQPKLRPVYDEMRAKLSELLALPLERISLKATTTERLGFAGREEGIAALASVTIAMPIGDTAS